MEKMIHQEPKVTDIINNILACGAEKYGFFVMVGTCVIRNNDLLNSYSEWYLWDIIHDIFYKNTPEIDNINDIDLGKWLTGKLIDKLKR